MKTIVLGNAPINNGNRGCVALSYCCIYLIDKLLGNGNYKLYLTDSEEAPGVHSVNIAGKVIYYESIRKPLFNSSLGVLKDIFKFSHSKHSYSIFRKADMIVDIGQGDSFTDIYGEWRFDWIDVVHVTSRFFRKPYLLLPQTVGPFSDSKIKSKAVKSINNAAFVMVRDKQSFDYVKQIASQQENVGEFIDVAFFLPYEKKEFDKKSIHVGLNISSLLWHGGYTKDNQFGLKCNYQDTIRMVINYFLSIPNVTLHLIGHVMERERHVENDYAVCYDLCEEYSNERLLLAPFFLSPVNAKSYISGLDFFMGARMHATIAAFSSGVPVVPMAYSRKFNGLFIDTLGYNCMVDMKARTETEILSAIQEVYSQRELLFKTIENINETVVYKRKQDLIDRLKSLLLK